MDLEKLKPYWTLLRTYSILAFTKFLVFIITAHNYTVENIFVPIFPYPLAIYKNVNNIMFVDTDNGLSLGGRIRLKYLLNHRNSLQEFNKYITKMDTRVIIMFRNNNNKLFTNVMNVDNKTEELSSKEYEFNTIKLYTKPANLCPIHAE